jgi:hypothetical protein
MRVLIMPIAYITQQQTQTYRGMCYAKQFCYHAPHGRFLSHGSTIVLPILSTT